MFGPKGKPPPPNMPKGFGAADDAIPPSASVGDEIDAIHRVQGRDMSGLSAAEKIEQRMYETAGSTAHKYMEGPEGEYLPVEIQHTDELKSFSEFAPGLMTPQEEQMLYDAQAAASPCHCVACCR